MSDELRIMLVRPRPGTVGETRRVVHVVVLDGEQLEADVFTTVCGQQLELELVEQLDAPRGMPCTRCLAYSPPPVEQRPLEDFPSLRRLQR